MGLIKEFRDFANRGSVVDMAVGIIVGGAFGKIVASFVADVLMPPIGLLLGGMDFSQLQVTLKKAVLDADGNLIADAVSLRYGLFIQTFVDFLIIAFAVFMFVRVLNRFKKKKEEAPKPPAEPTKEEILLTEIRDLLKERQA